MDEEERTYGWNLAHVPEPVYVANLNLLMEFWDRHFSIRNLEHGNPKAASKPTPSQEGRTIPQPWWKT